MLPIKPSMVNKFLTHNPISFKHMPFWCLILDQHLTPLSYRCPLKMNNGTRSGLITPKFHGKHMNYG